MKSSWPLVSLSLFLVTTSAFSLTNRYPITITCPKYTSISIQKTNKGYIWHGPEIPSIGKWNTWPLKATKAEGAADTLRVTYSSSPNQWNFVCVYPADKTTVRKGLEWLKPKHAYIVYGLGQEHWTCDGNSEDGTYTYPGNHTLTCIATATGGQVWG